MWRKQKSKSFWQTLLLTCLGIAFLHRGLNFSLVSRVQAQELNPTAVISTQQALAQQTIEALLGNVPSPTVESTPAPPMNLETMVSLTLAALTPSPMATIPIARPDGSLVCYSVQYARAHERAKELLIEVHEGKVGFLGGVSIDGDGPAMVTILGPYSGIHVVTDGIYCGEFAIEQTTEAGKLFHDQHCFNCELRLVVGPDQEPIRSATPSNEPTPTVDANASLTDANGYLRCPKYFATGTGQTALIDIYVPEGQIGMMGGVSIDNTAGPAAVTIKGPYSKTHTITDGSFCGYFPVARQREVEAVFLNFPNCVGCRLFEFGPNVISE